MKKSFILSTILFFTQSCFSFNYIIPQKGSPHLELSKTDESDINVTVIDQDLMDFIELLLKSNPFKFEIESEYFRSTKKLICSFISINKLVKNLLSLVLNNAKIRKSSKATINNTMIYCSDTSSDAAAYLINPAEMSHALEFSYNLLDKLNLEKEEDYKVLSFAIMHETGHIAFEDLSLKKERADAIKNHIINESKVDEKFNFDGRILNESKEGPINFKYFPENIKTFLNGKVDYDIKPLITKYGFALTPGNNINSFQNQSFTPEDKLLHDLIKDKCAFEKLFERRADIFAVKILGNAEGALRYFERFCDPNNTLPGSNYDSHDTPGQRIKLIQAFQKGEIDLDLATGEFIGKSVSEILNK